MEKLKELSCKLEKLLKVKEIDLEKYDLDKIARTTKEKGIFK